MTADVIGTIGLFSVAAAFFAAFTAMAMNGELALTEGMDQLVARALAARLGACIGDKTWTFGAPAAKGRFGS
jgi:hypothetical protein